MALSFIQATSAKSGTSSASFVAACAVPTSATNGDLLVMTVSLTNPGNPVATPTGWGVVTNASAGTAVSGVMAVTYFRIANTEPAAYSITADDASFWGTSMLCFRGAAASASVIDTGIAHQSGSAADVSVAAVTLTKSNGIQIAVAVRFGTITTPEEWKISAPWTLAVGLSAAQASHAVAYKVQTASGAQATALFSSSGADANTPWLTYTFGIVAAEAGGTTTYSLCLLGVGS